MKLEKIKKTSKELELEITDENETMLNPITEKLLQNNDVDYASYIADHPDSKKRRLYIRVKKGEPVDLLKKALKEVEADADGYLSNNKKGFNNGK